MESKTCKYLLEPICLKLIEVFFILGARGVRSAVSVKIIICVLFVGTWPVSFFCRLRISGSKS